jgi:UDP-glucuronate 4-epimerase
MVVLVTGCAGFIGMHVSQALLARGDRVIGIDNLNNYYDVSLKQARLSNLQSNQNFTFLQNDIRDQRSIEEMFRKYQPQKVVHLAAQAGVRFSVENPYSYVDNNLIGFINILEGCRHFSVKHLVYASSSSVYGGNTKIPFAESDRVDSPVSLYAATKKANELMAHTYSHLFGLPTTGLRFFTVYGPWGRPDMSPFLFADALLNNRPIKVFNHGKMMRDFTYIDDIYKGVIAVLDKPTLGNDSPDTEVNQSGKLSLAPYAIFNIGNNAPVMLMDYIQTLASQLHCEPKLDFLPMQAGDVERTMADTSKLEKWVEFKPSTDLADGVSKFVTWYRDYYSI